jgi:membrane protease YdiL (CAAX protease family)
MLESRVGASGDRVVASSSTSLFFVIALGMTFLLQLPAVLAVHGLLPGHVELYMLPGLVGVFGPVTAAIIAARREAGSAGVRAIFARLRRGPVGPIWYVVALGIFPAIYAISSASYRLGGGTDAGQWLYLPENPQHVLAMFLMPLVEEPGWRGFALPRLVVRYGRLPASLLLGLAWGFWHTTMFLLAGMTPLVFATSIVMIVAGSVIYSWIYHHTRGSLFLAILAHVGVHWSNPSHALPAHFAPYAVYTAGIVVFACILVFADRAVWRATPEPLSE